MTGQIATDGLPQIPVAGVVKGFTHMLRVKADGVFGLVSFAVQSLVRPRGRFPATFPELP